MPNIRCYQPEKSADPSDAEGAEDVAQDTMIRLWQLLAALERVESPEALTATIARRLALNACRRQSSRLPLADALRQLAASVYAQPDVSLQHHENLEWLDSQMRRLPSVQQQVFYMRQVEHRSHDEIARIVGIAPKSVSTLLARARKAIYEELDKRR
ncbi:RNA polymerase sigma factor [Prevotella sp. P5-108]|uniref:RNA polymerase sigma factor n=1 Tax=Prevotella sp. P5-108 TaxID=2024225 RepID=UPI00352F5D9E